MHRQRKGADSCLIPYRTIGLLLHLWWQRHIPPPDDLAAQAGLFRGSPDRGPRPGAFAQAPGVGACQADRHGRTLCGMKIDVEKLSLSELNSLLNAAERRKQLISSRRPIASVRRTVIALAAQHGYTIDELYGDRPVAEIAGKKRAPRRK